MAKSLSVLLIEDDVFLKDEFANFLKDFFDIVDDTIDTKSGYELYKKNSYDLVITDIELPKENGLSLVKRIKKINPKQTIIVVSAYTETEYFLKSIELGIYSFLLKPYDSQKLIQLFGKLTYELSKEKQHKNREWVYLSKNSKFNTEKNYLYLNNTLVNLTQKEEKLLSLLVHNIDNHVSNNQLIRYIWEGTEISNATIRALIMRLRKKLGNDSTIKNLKGRGYSLSQL